MSAYRTYRTAGPWFVGHAIKNGQLAIIGDVDSVVALLPDESMGCTLNEPNARLIASAPELLGALQETDIDLTVLMSNIADAMTRDPKWDGMREIVSKWRERNRSAIAKAAGEQS